MSRHCDSRQVKEIPETVGVSTACFVFDFWGGKDPTKAGVCSSSYMGSYYSLIPDANQTVFQSIYANGDTKSHR